jgi:hypothetical protein
MRTGHILGPPFKEAIRAAIRAALSSRHVQAYIFEVQELPVSASGRLLGGDALLITTTRLVYGERQEYRNCGEEDRLGNAGRSERDGREPGVIGELLQVPGHREVLQSSKKGNAKL